MFDHYETIVYCAFGGCGTVYLLNWASRKPKFARLPLYAVAAAIGAGLGQAVYVLSQKQSIDRQLAVWDYVHRHQEDFPEIKPKKYKEILEPWHPIR